MFHPPSIDVPSERATKRRLVVDLTPLRPGGENGGVKWFIFELLRHLPHHMRDWSITLLTATWNEESLKEEFPDFVCVRALDETGQKTPISLAYLPDGAGTALLYCPLTAPFFASPASPTVSTVVDLQFNAYPQFFTAEQVAERRKHILDCANICDAVVCISDHVRRDFLAFTGLPPSKVFRVYISTPARLADNRAGDAAAVLARYKLVPDRYLIYPANNWPHKNHLMLLLGFCRWQRKFPGSDLKLLCTGHGFSQMMQQMQDAIRAMRLEEHVVLSGFVPEDELAALMGNARALIFPSLFEGFGMPIVEAMAAGVPVLCSDTTSLPEVTDGAAVLFDPRRPDAIAEAIRRIEQEPSLAAQLAARGRARVAELGSVDDMARSYAAIFRGVVERWRREALSRVPDDRRLERSVSRLAQIYRGIRPI